MVAETCERGEVTPISLVSPFCLWLYAPCTQTNEFLPFSHTMLKIKHMQYCILYSP
jgi:hypothetical protein